MAVSDPIRPLPDSSTEAEVHCLPSTDADFVAFVHSLAGTHDQRGASVAQFEALVRQSYPDARVRVRDPLAETRPGQTVWYVFRDSVPENAVGSAIRVDPAPRAGGRGLDLRCFPSDDADFAVRVDALVCAAAAPHPTPSELEAALRLSYPAARVRVRDELAELAPGEVTWYIYRDGRAF